MNLPHRRPSPKSLEAMARAAEQLGSSQFDMEKTAKKAKKALREVIGHGHVELLSSCDAALLLVSKVLQGPIMVPDQGGWKGFRTVPRLFGLEVRELRTRTGLIEVESLASVLKKKKPAALLITSFAGYIAEQSVKEIHDVCQEEGVILIEDASGAIGDERLGKAENADIIIGSMGAPKILNLYSGGFVSTNNRGLLDNSRELIRACRINPVTCAGIPDEVKTAPKVLQALINYADIMKAELGAALHKDRRGVCVGLELASPKAVSRKAYQLGLKTDQGSPLTTPCPDYNRFLKQGLAVELKKLDVLQISEDDVLEMAGILRLAKL